MIRGSIPGYLLLVGAISIASLSCGSASEPVEDTAVQESLTSTRELVFADSIGVELGDSNFVLGSIEAVSHTLEGNILLLDRPAARVREYTADGEFVRNHGRRGSGPGEFINPLSMTRLTDGRMAVLDQQTGGIHLFSADGEWLGISAQITNEPVLWITPADGDQFIGTLNSWSIENDQMFATAIVGRFSVDSAQANLVYWENTFPFDFIDFTELVEKAYFAQTWASDRAGNVFMGPRDPEIYEITGFDVSGEPFIEISLDIPMVEKGADEIAFEAEFWNQRARNMGANVTTDFNVNPYRWMIHSLGVDGQNRLWVRRGTEGTPTFDVFDYTGEHLFTAALPAVSGYQGLLWEVKIDEFGILAWSMDPPDGYQKLYTLELLSD